MTEVNEMSELTGDQSSDHPPTLRFIEQNPTLRFENKILCSELSPINEKNNPDIAQQIHPVIEKSINAAIAPVMHQSESSLQTAVQKSIQAALICIKDEVHQATMTEMVKFQTNSMLKMLCETERLENYNRSDNLRIFNVEGDDSEWQKLR